MAGTKMFVKKQSAILGISLLAAATVVGCSKGDTPAPADSAATASATPATTTTPNAPAGRPRIRGTVVSVTDNMLTLSSDSGEIKAAFDPPLKVFASGPSTLAQVKPNSFVGVTSVAQADGTQRATEIHIFPEELRGMGEGSRPMSRRGGGNGGGGNGPASTMTNGTVSGAGANGGGGSTMTNGTISAQSGGTLTVQYAGGTQTITVPSDVTVTAVAPSQAKLAAGANVTVVADRQADGTLKASAVILGGGRGGGRRQR